MVVSLREHNNNFGERSIPNTPSLSLCVCVCVDVFFAVVSSGNNKKALAGALVELLLWRVIVCEKIFSVVKKRGSQRQSCEFRVSFLKVFFPFFWWKKTKKPQKKRKKKKEEEEGIVS